MRKLAVPIGSLILLYGLPLCAEPQLLMHWRILVLAAVCLILFLTQPALTLSEQQDHRKTDRYSMLAIIASALGCQILAVVEWGHFSAHPEAVDRPWVVSGALAMMIAGLWLRLWAIRTLGHFFTAAIRVQHGQDVVTSGPFAIVRHPSYLGSYVTIVGSALLLEAYSSALLTLIAVFLAYVVRIKTEEDVMTSSFGAKYREYARRIPCLIPGIW